MASKILTIAFLLGFTFQLVAQESDSRKQDHEALRALTKKATAAINSQDYDKLSQCFVDEFTFITIDQTVLKTKDEMQKYYKAVLNNKEYGIKSMKIAPSADILTEFPGNNVGYCYGTAENTYELESGKTVKMESRWSATLQKKDGEWKIVMVHAGINFIDNPLINTIASTAKNTMISMGILVFILIAVIMFLLVKNKKLSAKSASPAPTPDADTSD